MDEVVVQHNRTISDLLLQYKSLLKQINLVQDDDTIKKISSPIGNLTEYDQELHIEIVDAISDMAKKLQSLSWMSEHLKILHELGHTFTEAIEPEQIYEKAFELVSRVMPSEAFLIAFYQEDLEEIFIPFMVDFGKRYPKLTLQNGEGNVSKVIKTKQTIHIKTQDEIEQSTSVRWGNPEQNTGTAIFVPMLLGDQVKGVISAQCYKEFAYQKEHEELLRIIGYQLASAFERARLYNQLYHSSYHDDLTNLRNYRAFHRDLKDLLTHQGNGTVTLMMLDSDNLKLVNDQYGHNLGDMLIARIADSMRDALNEGEEAYRYAGDEFMLISKNISRSEAEEKIETIREYLRKNPIFHNGEVIQISFSAGIARYPDDAKDGESLKRSADKAMYISKKSGKNLTTIFCHGQ